MVEVIKRHRWGVFAMLGTVWLITNIMAALGGYHYGDEAPDPYGNVDIISADFGNDGWFYFVANFEKFACDIESLRVEVKYPAIGSFSASWEDVDGREDDEVVGLDNRSIGSQTLRIRWQMDTDFEVAEIRTAHLCPRRDSPDKRRVSKVFARLTGEALP